MNIISILCFRKTTVRIIALSIVAYCIFVFKTHSYNLESFFFDTYFVNMQHRTYLTDKVRNLQDQSFELSNGNLVAMKKWYSPKSADMQLDFMTQLTPRLGLVWGASTGNYGEKFVIQPSFKLGMVFHTQPTPNSELSLSLTRQLRGRLEEKPCIADYGSIGGVQTVNCRYAASTMEPSQTLKYLLNEKAPDSVYISLRYKFIF